MIVRFAERCRFRRQRETEHSNTLRLLHGRRLRLEALEGRRLLASTPLVVTTGVDESDGDHSQLDLSLREALLVAAEQPGDDVIQFDVELTGPTITLEPALGELLIDSNVDVQGPGSEQLAVDAGRRSRVFWVAQGVTAAISGLTITGGVASETNGGGIYNNGTLTLSRCAISENEAEGDDKLGGYGGGIYNTGKIALTDCVVERNYSDEGPAGGGIYNRGELTAIRTTIFMNDASDGSGGGIYNSGTAVLEQAAVTQNHASSGGGVYNTGTLDLSGTTISGNIVMRFGGAGIYSSGQVILTDSIIAENEALMGDGGGIYSSGPANLIDSTIIENKALLNRGGGVANLGTLTVAGTTLSDNFAFEYGGGIYSAHTLTVSVSTIHQNVAVTGGGGLFNDGTATLADTTISGNRGRMLGGGGIWNGQTLQLTESTVSGNSAADSTLEETAIGGGIRDEGTATLNGCTVAANSAEEHGGVYSESGNTTMHNTLVARNFLVDASVHDGTSSDVAGVFDAESSYNLIGVINGSDRLAGDGTIFGTLASPLHAKLGALQDNGGPTQTHAVWPQSPAVDAGSNARAEEAGSTRDQRGFDRFLDGDGDTIAVVDIGAYELAFDDTPPSATLVSAPDIVRFGANEQTFQVRYGDDMALEVLRFDDSDVRVTGPGGYDEAARLVSLDVASDGSPRTVTYRVPSAGVAWDSSDNGTYQLHLQADEVADLCGNFVAPGLLGTFAVAIDDQAPSPVPLHRQDPPGSLIYARHLSGGVFPAGKGTDRFTVALEAGQTFAVAVDPDPTLQPTVELLDPDGLPVGSATATSAGEDAVIGPVAITVAGEYTVAIAGAFGSTGACTVQLVVNAAVEAEAHDGPANDVPAAAQDLAGSFISWDGPAQRGAVLGRVDPDAAGAPEDWYRFTLEDGHSATVALTAELPGALSLQLHDGDGNRLAMGKAARNADWVISNFIDPTSDGSGDAYFVRVAGDPGGDYSLLVMRNADFDTEENGSRGTAQPLEGTTVILGHLGRSLPQEPDLAPAADRRPVATSDGVRYAPDRLMVCFAAGTKHAVRRKAVAALGGKVIQELPIIEGAVVQLADAKADPKSEAARWSAHPAIRFAEPDYQVQVAEKFPNDPDFSGLWGLHNTGQDGGTPDADVDAPEAWDMFTGSSTVVVASIDTGVDYTHPDLAANMWTNPGEIPDDRIDNDGNGYVDDFYGIDACYGDSDPMDDHYHGTHTAGTIGAVGNNGIGIVGVNWNVQIMALKFLDSMGYGWSSNAAICLQYMTTMKTAYGVNVVASNNSWGGGGYSQALYDAIEAGNEAGIMFVAAAGNDTRNTDDTPLYPAGYDLEGIISVAASNRYDQMADFSNYGAASVDLAAPGLDILSTMPYESYAPMSGTSMASPHVAGAVALLMGHDRRASLEEVKTALLDGVDRLPDFAHTTVSGGRLNLPNALRMLSDLGDWYQVAVESGDVLQIETATPAYGAAQLDPAVELYDPQGTRVAFDDDSAGDGRNARLAHEAVLSGIYAVRVFVDGVDQSGEYLLKIAGRTAPLPAPGVVATEPAVCDVRWTTDSVQIAVRFDDAILLSSLDASDLTLGGAPAVAVTAVDVNTALFDFAYTPVEGLNPVELAAGALLDLQGTPVEPFAGSLWGIGSEIIVSTAVDEKNGLLEPGNLSLREALAISREFSGGHAIRFAPSLHGARITLDPHLGPLEIHENVDVYGPGRGQLTIDAAGEGRILEVARDATATLRGLSLVGGRIAGSGGAILNSGHLTIIDADVSGNRAVRSGGAIWNTASRTPASLTLENVTMSDNRASRSGGAIWSHGDRGWATSATATLTIRDSVFSGNQAVDDGGAIYNWVASNVALTNVTLSENSADSGGGLFNWSGEARLTGCTLSGNSAADIGGAIWNFSRGELIIDRSTIAGNSTSWKGGGLVNYGGTVTVSRTTISGNSVEKYGGGILDQGDSHTTLVNTTVSGNSAGYSGGGVCLWSSDTPPKFLNVTIFGNTALKDGPGMHFYNTTAILQNTIVHDLSLTTPLDPASSHNLIDVDPALGPLADNGGPVLTHALLPGSPAVDAGSDPAAIGAGLTRDGRGFYRFADGDGDGTATVDIGAYEFGSTQPAEVVGRRVFYNASAFDGGDAAADHRDDDAVAPDKQALRPGQTATAANYTSYSRGINGVMIDVADPPGGLTADDFRFKIGNHDDPASWAPVATAAEITVREGAGVGQSDRVTITWPDHTIQDTWLQVTVLVTADTGLAEADVFYFGNAVGETGNSTADAKVNAVDVLLARNNPRTLLNEAPVDFRCDFNRDGRVNATDMLIARNNQTHLLDALKLIAVPGMKRSPIKDPSTSAHDAEPARWSWFCEFEGLATQQRSMEETESAQEAVDLLLASL